MKFDCIEINRFMKLLWQNNKHASAAAKQVVVPGHGERKHPHTSH